MRLYDSSFSELRAVLEWEFRKREKLVLPVPAYNTSRECFLCGGINQSLTLEDRVFLCPHCGFILDRDLNASLVLLKRSGWVPPAVACEASPNTSSTLSWVEEARRGGDSGSSRLQAGVAHIVSKCFSELSCLKGEVLQALRAASIIVYVSTFYKKFAFRINSMKSSRCSSFTVSSNPSGLGFQL